MLVIAQADLLVLICFTISSYGNKTKHHTKNLFENTKCNAKNEPRLEEIRV